MTDGFLILIGYRGEYRPRKHDADEIARARERTGSDEREMYKRMPRPLPPPSTAEREALDRLLRSK